MYRYAQIDGEGAVISDSFLAGEVIADNMVAISDDFDLANKKYVSGTWIEVEPTPDTKPEPTQLDKIEANLDYLVLINS